MTGIARGTGYRLGTDPSPPTAETADVYCIARHASDASIEPWPLELNGFTRRAVRVLVATSARPKCPFRWRHSCKCVESGGGLGRGEVRAVTTKRDGETAGGGAHLLQCQGAAVGGSGRGSGARADTQTTPHNPLPICVPAIAGERAAAGGHGGRGDTRHAITVERGSRSSNRLGALLSR
jgi:hypothetical protein